MRRLELSRHHTDDELDKKKGQFSPISCRLEEGEFAIFDPSLALPVAVCLRHVLNATECQDLKGLLWRAATSSDRRGPSAGPLHSVYPSCVRVNDFAMRKVKGNWSSQYNKAVLSGTVGYNKFGKPTAWTVNNPDKLDQVVEHLSTVQKAYAHVLPEAEKVQTAALRALPHLGGTCFRTLFVNRNFRTALHKDCNVDRSQYGILLVLGERPGGCRIQLPQYERETELGAGDVLIFKPDLWHCNTEIKPFSERLSIVMHA